MYSQAIERSAIFFGPLFMRHANVWLGT